MGYYGACIMGYCETCILVTIIVLGMWVIRVANLYAVVTFFDSCRFLKKIIMFQ